MFLHRLLINNCPKSPAFLPLLALVILVAKPATVVSNVFVPSGVSAGNDPQPAGCFAKNGAGERKDPLWGAIVKDAPAWLEMPNDPHQLYSEYKFAGLAGRLIAYKVVDASDCPANGFLPNGAANECGLLRALPAVFEWQNRFNAAILATSQETGVPPILLKNLFAWESQFWPRTVFVHTYEYGLGHITEMGADSALRWNAPFYDDICADSFSADTCKKPYAGQPANIRAALMGVAIQQVNADCANCPNGLDLTLAESSIPVFAQTVLANASLVKQYVSGLTGRPAAELVEYEDLWKFTLASYNAGPGCFTIALSRTLNARLPLDWKNLSTQLDPGCQGAINYVNFISQSDYYGNP